MKISFEVYTGPNTESWRTLVVLFEWKDEKHALIHFLSVSLLFFLCCALLGKKVANNSAGDATTKITVYGSLPSHLGWSCKLAIYARVHLLHISPCMIRQKRIICTYSFLKSISILNSWTFFSASAWFGVNCVVRLVLTVLVIVIDGIWDVWYVSWKCECLDGWICEASLWW